MIGKVFKKMLVTQILSAMTVTLCLLIDSIMIGQFIGVKGMTAYGLSTPILLVFAALGAMIAAGVQVVCGNTMGKGDEKGTNSCFSVSSILALGISVIGLILVFTIPDQLCSMLGAGSPADGGEIFINTKNYLFGFIIGAPAFIFAQIMVPYIQMVGEQTRLITAVAAMTIADVVFDLLNVLVFKGGMFGMGLASSLSYYIAVAIGITYFFSKKNIFKFGFKYWSLKTCKEVIKNGIPTVINQVSLVLLVFLFNRILLHVGGDLAVAAYSVITTVSNICYSFGSGVAAVSLTLSSVLYGDEDRSSLHMLVRIMTRYAVVINIVVTLVVILIAPLIVKMFLEEESATGMAVLGLRLFSLSLVPCSLNTVFKNFYQGTSRIGFTEVISLLQNFALTAIAGSVLSLVFGTTGVWLGFVCGETLTFLIVCIVVYMKDHRLQPLAEVFAYLKDEVGVEDENCFETKVVTLEEVVQASEQVRDFCLKHGEDQRTAMCVALCVEEMAVNTIKFGFGADKKKDHSIEIRYMHKNGKRTLRLRDDCMHFDPVTYTTDKIEESPEKHIGIRMMMNMVKDAKYISTLGLNNLTMVF